MEVSEELAGLLDGRSLVLLLDVHMERIEMQLERRTADRLDQLQALVAGIEEVGLKTIERLHANLHTLFLSVGSELLEVFHHERKFFLLLLGIHRISLAHHAVHRANQ